MIKKQDLNYKIGKFFLYNSRLTLFALILLVLLGGYATLKLKTSGFPNPDVGVVTVTSVYPGASSDTVLRDVTKPVENSIKTIDGLDSYRSDSQNSVSIVVATLKPGFKTETLLSKITTEVKAITLPTNVNVTISRPVVGAPDFIFTLTDENLPRLYQSFSTLKSDLESLSDTKSINVDNEILEQVVIEIDQDKVTKLGSSVNNIQQALKSLKESLPVTSNVQVDSIRSSIVAQYNKKPGLAVLNELDVATIQGSLKLKDVANSISIKQKFNKTESKFKGSKEGDGNKETHTISQAVVINVYANSNIDTANYLKSIEDKISKHSFIGYKSVSKEKSTLALDYAVTERNKEQVDEVLSGLIGGPLKIKDKNISQIGWLLGGIQLVLLAMWAFVSWRAALIAAFAIPLSLIFTNIYLFIIGESLNTLVLFSFVLVIGLVVDPALVIIESIQRKIDAGLKGKKAALAAITDVGGGLFMATLTNIIVFAPFGLISGFLGQIFSYIPLTIVPAIIGSYLVPLIFLTWLASKILVKSKNSKADITDTATPEEVEIALHKSELENMWPLAKKLVSLNRLILHSHWLLRLGIILGTFIISLLISSSVLGSGLVKTVQFSAPVNPPELSLIIVHKTTALDSERNEINKLIIDDILKDEDVSSVYPFQQNTYIVSMKDVLERKDITTNTAKKLDEKIKQKFQTRIFDMKIEGLKNGPAGSLYPVQIALNSEGLKNIKQINGDVMNKVRLLCDRSGKISIDKNCDGNKINILRFDDGYTGKDNPVNYIEFDKEKLFQKGFILPNNQGPSIILPYSQIKNYFSIDDSKSQIEIDVDGKQKPVIITSTTSAPKSIDEIRNTNLVNLKGISIPLTEVATVVIDSPLSSQTRVKSESLSLIKLGFEEKYDDQQSASKITNAIVDYFKVDANAKEVGINIDTLKTYSEGGAASVNKSFGELLLALIFAILASYVVLAIFFRSITTPLAILYTIPLTFIGIFPALGFLGGGQFGFLEIIGLIILVGIVENVAIFLIDSANQSIENEGVYEKEAIAIASGLRFRPVLLTKLTAIASLAPLAFLSETYRPLSIVIIFGLLTSGFLSLITTPILFIFFRKLSRFINSKISTLRSNPKNTQVN